MRMQSSWYGRLVALTAACVIYTSSAHAQQLNGAIFTTDGTCSAVNMNIFDQKEDVSLNGGPEAVGGPRRTAPAGLPDAEYYVQVTEPNGVPLGTSVGTPNERPVRVVNGRFEQCYQLFSLVVSARDGQQIGYDTTTNEGDEYKVWISTSPDFTPSLSKTDNFKVKAAASAGELVVTQFYDANANGRDDDQAPVEGWRVTVAHATHDHLDLVRSTTVRAELDAAEYVVASVSPIESNWRPTTAPRADVALEPGRTVLVSFGALCLGPGGGKTLGFWSNKNGMTFATASLARLRELNLVGADGAPFDPGSYSQYRSWLLSANATSMSYMLSAQLTAMALNLWSGGVSSATLVDAPGTASANPLGYARIGDLIGEANAELAGFPVTFSNSPRRAYQEALKNALDRANNNFSFVQSTACAFSFIQ